MNFYKLKFSLLLLLFLGNGFAGAQTLSLTLEDSIDRAVSQSINLAKSALDLDMAKFRADRLWAELFPSFSLRGSFTFLPGTPLFTDPYFGYDPDNLTYSVSAGVSFSFNFGITTAMKLTELAYSRGMLDYENARKRVVLDVTKAFYSLLAGQVNVKNLEETLGLAERELEKNRIARENGLIGELPWLQSRLSVETARYNLSNAFGTWENSLRDFMNTLGIDPDTKAVLEGTISPVQLHPDPEALILEYLPKRPDIVSQRQLIETRELSARQSALSSKAPSLSVSATWSGNPPRNSPISAGFSDSISANISVSIPIDPWIPGTKSNQTQRSNNIEIEKAKLDLINTENSAKSNIRSLCVSLTNSWRSVEIARLRAEIAQRTYELSEAGFRNGIVEFLRLESTRNDFDDAMFRLLQSELSYFNILLDLASALNVDLETLTRSGE